MSRSIRVVLGGFAVSLAIIGASLMLNSTEEEELISLGASAAVPTRVPFDQAKSDAMHFRALDGAFYSMVRRGRGVRVYVPFPTKLSPLGGYRDLRVGSAFSEGDKHYSYNYRVQSIEKDGVVIAYSGSEGHPGSYQGKVSGRVRLNWRFRPTPTPLPHYMKSPYKGTPTKTPASST